MAAIARYLHHPSRRNHGVGSRRIAPLDLSGRRFPSRSFTKPLPPVPLSPTHFPLPFFALRDELKRLNDQLRQINEALRRQAKIESYAPSLSYAPVSRIKETDVIVDPRKQQLLASLRTGKNFLRNQNLDEAFAQFKEAFELAQSMGDHLEEKKAARGLGASLQRQGKYREAIKYYSKVLEISKRTGEDSGITEAYGAIADCYTELGDLERAAKFYDKYIARLETD
ncbi:hypothetical protein B296_00048680 [Ensete ventricosum]|uniref:Uncharacterized protein n=1 Tax=Ensete ventricosum TaxID=4639 RepID=A0A426YNL2_ENSVE|nr:hypothetical protein B296_00048680 [Ensete ventricosum]